MSSRLRLVLPTADTLGTAAFCFLVIQGCRVYAEWRGGAPLLPGDVILHVADEFLRGCALALGLFRVVAFHPFYRPGYRAWLERTPWTYRKPLPMGPVALVWEDGVALLALVLLTLTVPGCDPIRLLALFTLSYLAALALTLGPTGEPAYGYLLGFGIGLMVRVYPRPDAMLAAGIVVAAAGQVGLRRSLARFPWPGRFQPQYSAEAIENTFRQQQDQACGWPYDRLRPFAQAPVRLTFLDAVLFSMLAGWWLFALEGLFADPRDALGLFAAVLPMGTFIAALLRLVKYTQGYASPLNLWGRLLTFRWIVPGYDQVFVGPMLTIAMAPLSVAFFYHLGWPAQVFLPITGGLVIFAAIATPPSLRRWRLTGQHRIVPAFTNQKDFVKVG